MAEVKATFRPEFVNRIDDIVVFHALDERSSRSRNPARYLRSAWPSQMDLMLEERRAT